MGPHERPLQLGAHLGGDVPGGEGAEAGADAVGRRLRGGERLDHPAGTVDRGQRVVGEDDGGALAGDVDEVVERDGADPDVNGLHAPHPTPVTGAPPEATDGCSLGSETGSLTRTEGTETGGAWHGGRRASARAAHAIPETKEVPDGRDDMDHRPGRGAGRGGTRRLAGGPAAEEEAARARRAPADRGPGARPGHPGDPGAGQGGGGTRPSVPGSRPSVPRRRRATRRSRPPSSRPSTRTGCGPRTRSTPASTPRPTTTPPVRRPTAAAPRRTTPTRCSTRTTRAARTGPTAPTAPDPRASRRNAGQGRPVLEDWPPLSRERGSP